MKDLDAILMLILVLVGIGSCSIYSAGKADAIVNDMIAKAMEVRK